MGFAEVESVISHLPVTKTSQLVLWAQSTTTDHIGAKKFSLSQSHSAHHQTTKFHQSTKSVPTQIHTKQTHKNTKVFEELAHLLLPPLEKHVRLGHEKKITVCIKSSTYTTKDLTW